MLLNPTEHYIVGTDGSVFSNLSGKYLKPILASNGYYVVTLQRPVRRQVMIHRLVAETHIPKVDGCTVVNHKDFDISNNAVDNLEWVTHQENCAHAYMAGRYPKGEDQGLSKLCEEDIVSIRSRYTPRCKSNGASALAREYGVDKSNISCIVLRKTWRHID